MEIEIMDRCCKMINNLGVIMEIYLIIVKFQNKIKYNNLIIEYILYLYTWVNIISSFMLVLYLIWLS